MDSCKQQKPKSVLGCGKRVFFLYFFVCDVGVSRAWKKNKQKNEKRFVDRGKNEEKD